MRSIPATSSARVPANTGMPAAARTIAGIDTPPEVLYLASDAIFREQLAQRCQMLGFERGDVSRVLVHTIRHAVTVSCIALAGVRRGPPSEGRGSPGLAVVRRATPTSTPLCPPWRAPPTSPRPPGYGETARASRRFARVLASASAALCRRLLTPRKRFADEPSIDDSAGGAVPTARCSLA